MIASVAAIVLALVVTHPVAYVAAWLSAAFLGMGLGCLYLVKHAAAQQGSWFEPSRLPTILYRVSVLLAVSGVIVSALRFAMFIGRM